MGLVRIYAKKGDKARKRKPKFSSAEAAARDRENRRTEAELLAKYQVEPKRKRKPAFKEATEESPTQKVLRLKAELGALPLKAGSRPDPVAVGGVQAAKRKQEDYVNGNVMLGQLHKSNMIAEHVDNKEFAKEITTMRRNNNG